MDENVRASWAMSRVSARFWLGNSLAEFAENFLVSFFVALRGVCRGLLGLGGRICLRRCWERFFDCGRLVEGFGGDLFGFCSDSFSLCFFSVD